MFKLIISASLIIAVIRCSALDVNLPSLSTSEQTEQDEQAFQSVTEKEERRLQGGAGSTSCVEIGKQYTGLQMQTFSIFSAIECFKKCLETLLCDYWSHNIAGNLCTTMKEVTAKTTVAGVSSGKANCYSRRLPFVRIRNYSFHGTPFQVHNNVLEANRCFQLCFVEHSCIIWRYYRLLKKCELYKEGVYTEKDDTCSVEGDDSENDADSDDNVVLEDFLRETRNNDCVQSATFYGGIKAAKKYSMLDCYLLCLTVPCHNWSWNIEDSSCYIQPNEVQTAVSYLMHHFLSGRVNCVTNTIALCIEENVRYTDTAVFTFPVLSLHHCYQICITKQNCQFYYFKRNELECVLVEPVNGRVTSIADQNSISGTICSTPLTCVKHGMKISGNLVTTKRTFNIFQCLKLCQSTNGCKGFNFRRGPLSECEILDSLRSISSDAEHDAAFSNCDAVCFKHNRAFLSETFVVNGATNLLQCQRNCAESTTCAHFNWYPKVNKCHHVGADGVEWFSEDANLVTDRNSTTGSGGCLPAEKLPDGF